MVDLNNVKVGLLPAVAGFITLFGFIVTGVTWGTELDKEVQVKLTEHELKIVQLQKSVEATEENTEELQKEQRQLKEILLDIRADMRRDRRREDDDE